MIQPPPKSTKRSTARMGCEKYSPHLEEYGKKFDSVPEEKNPPALRRRVALSTLEETRHKSPCVVTY